MRTVNLFQQYLSPQERWGYRMIPKAKEPS